MGGYDDTPAQMASDISVFCKEGLINLAGGCCGTTPPHIKAITAMVATHAPRVRTPQPPMMHLSGLEAAIIDKSVTPFANIGERCNIAGSIQFKKLILGGKFNDAMAVARKQVRSFGRGAGRAREACGGRGSERSAAGELWGDWRGSMRAVLGAVD